MNSFERVHLLRPVARSPAGASAELQGLSTEQDGVGELRLVQAGVERDAFEVAAPDAVQNGADRDAVFHGHVTVLLDLEERVLV